MVFDFQGIINFNPIPYVQPDIVFVHHHEWISGQFVTINP